MRKRFLFGAFLLTLGALQSAECVFNSTFDLGHDGFFASRFLRPDTNAQMRYLPLETVRENSNSVLRVDNPYNERIELNAIEIQLKQNLWTAKSNEIAIVRNHKIHQIHSRKIS